MLSWIGSTCPSLTKRNSPRLGARWLASRHGKTKAARDANRGAALGGLDQIFALAAAWTRYTEDEGRRKREQLIVIAQLGNFQLEASSDTISAP